MTIKREKWLRGVYSFVILSVGAPIFVVANQLQNSYLLILTIGVLCLIVCCIPKKWVRLLLSLPVMIGCLFLYFPSKTFSILWILQFFSSVTEEFFHLSQGKLYYLPEKTAFFSHNVADLFIYYIDRGLRLLVRTLSFFDGLLHDAYRFSEKRFTVRNDCGSNCFVRVSGSKAIFLHPVVVEKHSIPVIDYSSAYLFLNF
ncbi:hypothetical protein LOS19_09070 [Enterococcus faecium]|nr:hypothetical protein [Enterococcus faecium]